MPNISPLFPPFPSPTTRWIPPFAGRPNRAGLQKWAKKHQNAPEPKIVVVVIDVPRYNPLLTYNPILQTTTYLSTIVGTFWPTINYQQNQLPTPYQSLLEITLTTLSPPSASTTFITSSSIAHHGASSERKHTTKSKQHVRHCCWPKDTKYFATKPTLYSQRHASRRTL